MALADWISGFGRRPRVEGQLHPAFAPVADALRAQLAESPGGAAVCVYQRGECVVDIWGGDRDDAGSPWLPDTMSPSFSTTKGVAATLLHIAVDKGLLDYEDPVARHWPEFAQAGKAGILVRHVLAHQSGLYHIRQMIDRADRMLDWDYMVRAIEQSAPIHAPGERTGYHGLTFGFLVGELLRRVTGRDLAELVREQLVEPLALDGMYIGAPREALLRAAQLIWPPNRGAVDWIPSALRARALRAASPLLERSARWVGLQLDVASILDSLAPRGIGHFDFGSQEVLRATIPAANGLFTARSLARMYAALACGGELDGVRILSAATLERAITPQSSAARLAVIPFDMRWRLGYHAVFTTRGSPRRAFGHFGFGGSGAWAEPRRELAVAMIVNAGMGTPFGDLRIARVSAAALSAADARERSRSSSRARSGSLAVRRSPLTRSVSPSRADG